MALIAKDPESPAVIPQGTAAWVRERIGHLTASNMSKALSMKKDGTDSAERRLLKHQVLAERLADAAIDHYLTADMQWGLDCEPAAKDAYIKATGFTMLPSGFVKHRAIEFFGASPDGFITPDGLAEFKCPRTTTHVAYMLAGEVPVEYKPQMLAQLACTGRRWCDFVSYDPRLPQKQSLFIKRFEPKPEEILAIEEAARRFLEEVEEMFQRLTETGEE